MSRSRQYQPRYQKYGSTHAAGRDNRQMYHKRYRSMVRQSIRSCKDYDELIIPHYHQGWNRYDWPDAGSGWDSYYDAMKEDDRGPCAHDYYYFRGKNYLYSHRLDNVKSWKKRRRK